MAGLGGLKKKAEAEVDQIADYFISGAERRVKDLGTSERKFIRCTFSLNNEVSQLIDELVVKGQNARISRSSIVRIALEHLGSLSNEEIKDLVNKSSL